MKYAESCLYRNNIYTTLRIQLVTVERDYSHVHSSNHINFLIKRRKSCLRTRVLPAEHMRRRYTVLKGRQTTPDDGELHKRMSTVAYQPTRLLVFMATIYFLCVVSCIDPLYL